LWYSASSKIRPSFVIPAKAGIQVCLIYSRQQPRNDSEKQHKTWVPAFEPVKKLNLATIRDSL
tara:strand:+ start:3716 stop:3904 length:189 start_codon:yes stop_codon:yes gene_type:complete